jgi:hypothetical protein
MFGDGVFFFFLGGQCRNHHFPYFFIISFTAIAAVRSASKASAITPPAVATRRRDQLPLPGRRRYRASTARYRGPNRLTAGGGWGRPPPATARHAATQRRSPAASAASLPLSDLLMTQALRRLSPRSSGWLAEAGAAPGLRDCPRWSVKASKCTIQCVHVK